MKDMKLHTRPNLRISFFTMNRVLAGLAWLFVFIIFWWYTSTREITTVELTRRVIGFLSGNPIGFLFYIGLYMIRPLFIFPATLVTMAAGYLYGPLFGIILAIIASNLSSMIAFFIGKFFGSQMIENFFKYDLIKRYSTRLRENSFETSLILRFLFLRYDLVIYFSGFLKINWRGFLLATILGSIPGTISFGLIGAAFEGEFSSVQNIFDFKLFILSVIMFFVSIALSRWFKLREMKRILVENDI